MSQNNINLPIVFDDLRSEETILQLSSLVENFNFTSTKMIEQINNLIFLKLNAIGNLENRLNMIDFKIKKIKGSNKPIKILSSSKYPNCSPNEQICKNEAQSLHESSTFKQVIFKLKSPTPTLDDTMLKDRNKYFIKEIGLSKIPKKESLGNFERSVNDQINSTCSLLLFNTAEHV